MDISDAIEGRMLRVKVRPGARSTALSRVEGGVALIDIAAQAEQGRANAELERFLSRLTGKRAKVVSGATARRKLVRLE